ncbi:MAG TPA: 50S ribosomal protein L19 [Patescibacteria group bacterium]|nr:50S ribosomal protein L19 [Patescibacteria group bacterium]
MSLTLKHKTTEFGVGDEVRIRLKVQEGEKTRNQIFEGMVIGIKGDGENKTFTVRKIAEGNVGAEMIFPINTPSIDEIKVVRVGHEGAQHAKLYYVREKSRREIEKIYSRAKNKNVAPKAPKKKTEKKETKKASVKKVASKKVSK